MAQSSEYRLEDLVFVGLNSRVIALDRYEGKLVWEWKSPRGSGFVSLLLDGDRLVASVNGYVTCLDPIFGQEVWSNPLKGFGTGLASLASVHGNAGTEAARAAERKRQADAAAATTTATTATT